LTNENHSDLVSANSAFVGQSLVLPVHSTSNNRRLRNSVPIDEQIRLAKAKYGEELVDWAINPNIDICGRCRSIRRQDGVIVNNHTSKSCPEGAPSDSDRKFMNALNTKRSKEQLSGLKPIKLGWLTQTCCQVLSKPIVPLSNLTRKRGRPGDICESLHKRK
jgi:hypothetical protein